MLVHKNAFQLQLEAQHKENSSFKDIVLRAAHRQVQKDRDGCSINAASEYNNGKDY